MNQYLTNLWLWARGIPKLWTHAYHLSVDPQDFNPRKHIRYVDGWGPWRFLFPYCTSYLLSTLLGYPIRPFSGVLWEEARWQGSDEVDTADPANWQAHAVVVLDKLFRKGHCEECSHRATLWGSKGVQG